MKKNVSGQAVGAQLITASDGSAFTGAVTVSVTGDAGTQATGSVGSGACTHEGNGYHTYAPAQAETNYDLVAYTFTGSGAIPTTVQIYTTFPQTGDSFDRIGATGSGLTSLSTAAELAKVPKSDGTASWNATALGDINAQADTALADYDGPTKAELDAGLAALNDLDAAGIRTAVGLASANMDTQFAASAKATGVSTHSAADVRTEIDSNSTQVAAIKAKTDELTFTKANELDANMQSINGVTLTGDGSGTPFDV